MRNLLATLLAVLFAGLAAPRAEAQRGLHKDPRIGFSFKVPSGWEQIPLKTEQVWIVAKYQSDKVDRTFHGESQSSWTATPEVTVIAFLDQMVSRAEEEEEDEEREQQGEQDRTKVRVTSPFRDYEGYLKQVRSGYFIEEDVQEQIKGIPVRKLVIKSEQLSGPTTRYETWIYSTDLGDVAVETYCFEDNYKKHKSTISKLFKSFKLIERTEDLNIHSGTYAFVSISGLFGLTPEERRLRRQEQERQEWKRMVANLPSGWDTDVVDGVKVANHSDDKYARKVVERIQAVRSWLEDTFPQIGPEEYARTPLVRICADRQEERSFLRGVGLSGGTELVTHKDKSAGSASREWQYVSYRTMQIWFTDRDWDLWLNMPEWIKRGLRFSVEQADVKGKRLDFDANWLELNYRHFCKDDEPLPLRSILTMSPAAFRELNEQKDYRANIEAAALTQFLLKARSGKIKQLLPEYLAHAGDVLKEMDAEEDPESELEKPKNEEEEEAYFEERQRRAEARQQRLLEETLSRAFAEWSDSDWQRLERDFLKTIL